MKQIFVFIAFLSFRAFSQNVQDGLIDAIESGKQDSVKKIVAFELRKNPRNADWQYLQAILLTDGVESVTILKSVVKQGNNCKYTDAAWFRLFQYYYALGLYKQAGECGDTLQLKFSKSKYSGRMSSISGDLSSKDEGVLSKENGKTDLPVDLKEIETNSKDLFNVQIGAFTKKENAEQIVKRLNAKNTGIIEKNVGGTIFYIVSVNSFQTETEAKEYSLKINKKLALQSRVQKKP